ncbi:hypothetical protein ACFYYL_36890 [Actinomadura geliboluensis]|uniref:hypothetical protein n=1 Tax=Actinomadura geliboluensis TaxID=882440 RepID=UPI00369AF87B
MEPSSEGQADAGFAAAWAAVDDASDARSLLNDLWNDLRAEGVFYASVHTGTGGHGRLDVHCDWPDVLKQATEDTARSFVDALGRVFDSAILATARIVCAAFGEPDADAHRMLYLPTSEELSRSVREGHYSGLRPDQIRLIEAFQPFDKPSQEQRSASAMIRIRTAMRHLRNLQSLPGRPDERDRIAVWAHSAQPEIFVDPPGQVLSVNSTGDGVLETVRTVASFHVTGGHGNLDVEGNPNIAFDVIGNRPPWPKNPDDNFSARSRLLIAIASEFIRGCERSVGVRAPLPEPLRLRAATNSMPVPGPSWAPAHLDEGENDLSALMSQSDIGLASYRNDDGEFIMLVQSGQSVYGRPIPPAMLLDASKRQGAAAEDAAIEAASMWGLPDFVFRPQIIAKGSGRRELGDATIITGSKAVAVQVKSREGEPKDDDAEARWLTKKAIEGARQAAGTVRTLRAAPTELANERGRTVTCHGDQLAWMGVVILDHAAPPNGVVAPAFGVRIPVIAMLRRDWDFLFDHLRSVSAVVDYLHRITDEPPVAIGDEPVRYYELAHADEHTPPRTAPAWIEQTGATHTARPILPKAPASAEDAAGHTFFRVLLEDIAESEFTGEEQHRLEILAKLDRFSVAERANLGRLLIERLEAAANVEAGTTAWQHRLIIQDDNGLQLFFSVGSHLTQTHREAYKGWVLLRRHELIEITSADPLPWTVAVLLTPRYDGYRAWDTTLIATCDDTILEDHERDRLTALWSDSRTSGEA